MSRTPAQVRQLFLYCLAVPIVAAWLVTVLVYERTRDIAGLTVTTPLMFILLSVASGVKLTKKDDDGS